MTAFVHHPENLRDKTGIQCDGILVGDEDEC